MSILWGVVYTVKIFLASATTTGAIKTLWRDYEVIFGGGGVQV